MAKAKASAARAKPKATATAKPRPGNAAVVLREEVGQPHNINTVDIDNLRRAKAWLATDEHARAATAGELAVALHALRGSPGSTTSATRRGTTALHARLDWVASPAQPQRLAAR